MNNYRPDLRVKLLNGLCCDICGESLVFKPARLITIACEKCCIFNCQDCLKPTTPRCNCGSPMSAVYIVLGSLICLLQCPVEELRLIEIPVRSSSVCHKCGAKDNLYRFGFQQIHCADCISNKNNYWLLSSPLEKFFLNLTAELWFITKATSSAPQNIDETPLVFTFSCPKCYRPDAAHKGTELHCSACGTITALPCGGCMLMFLSIMLQIPRKQLKFLTYSKWSEIFSCSACKDQCQELYTKCFYTVETKDKVSKLTRLYGFFNKTPPRSMTPTTSITFAQILKEEAALHEATFTRDIRMTNLTFGTNTTDPTNYKNISTLSLDCNVQAPTMITCKCGRADDLKDMFYCQTCSEYGICGVCVVRNHKGHEIEDTLDSTIMSIVSKYSEKSLKKIANWTEEYRKVDRESEKAFRKLCGLLGSHLKTAATCGDVEQCAEILSKCDVTKIEHHIKVLLHIKKMAIHEIEEFCAQLDN